MSFTTSDLSLEGFASIDATLTKHAGFVTRALLAQLVETSACNDVVEMIASTDPAVMYQDICDNSSIDRRARTVDAVLTFFDNSPEVVKMYPARKQEWEYIKTLVEEQERASIAESTDGITIATGMAYAGALEHSKTWERLLKLRLPTSELKAAIQDALDCWKSDPMCAEEIPKQWKSRLELINNF